MKKRLAFLTLVAFVTTTGAALAATTINEGGDLKVPDTFPQAGSSITKLSNNVSGTIVSSSNQFAAALKHKNGTKNYAASSTDTKIYWKEVATDNKGKTDLEITLDSSDTSDFNDWSSL